MWFKLRLSQAFPLFNVLSVQANVGENSILRLHLNRPNKIYRISNEKMENQVYNYEDSMNLFILFKCTFGLSFNSGSCSPPQWKIWKNWIFYPIFGLECNQKRYLMIWKIFIPASQSWKIYKTFDCVSKTKLINFKNVSSRTPSPSRSEGVVLWTRHCYHGILLDTAYVASQRFLVRIRAMATIFLHFISILFVRVAF